VHLGARQIQLLRNVGDGLGRHAAKRFLDLMQDGEQRPGQVAMLPDGGVDCFADIRGRN